MPNFKYIAKDTSGKTLMGNVEFESKMLLIDSLRQKGLVIISIEETKAKGKSFRSKRIKLDDLVIFSRQLATMVNSGIPLIEAIDILGLQVEKPDFRKVLLKVKNDIETGSSLSEAMAVHPNIFSPLYINMVRAGESSGLLDEILDRLSGYLEKAAALARKIRSSLIYPAVVVSMAALITLILILKVIPTFKGIFETLGGTLPLPTRILIAFSDLVRTMFVYIVAVLVVAVILFGRFIRTDKGRLMFDRFCLKAPVFGVMFQKVAIAKFARTLSTLTKSGVPILISLEIVSKTAGNKVLELAINEVRKGVREGEMIAGPLSKTGLFPPMVVRMIAVGEKTGKLENMLSKIADFYEEQVDAAVSGLTSLIEPLIIAFLGIVIGGIVIAMFLPIFKITELLG